MEKIERHELKPGEVCPYCGQKNEAVTLVNRRLLWQVGKRVNLADARSIPTASGNRCCVLRRKRKKQNKEVPG